MITYRPKAYDKINALALQAQCKLPDFEINTAKHSKSRQEPDKTYRDYVFHL